VAKQGRVIEIAKRWIALQSKQKGLCLKRRRNLSRIETKLELITVLFDGYPDLALATFSQLATLAVIQSRAEHWRLHVC
jgi:hypothetical protein